MSLDVVGLPEALSVKKAVANPNSKSGPMGGVRHFEQTRMGKSRMFASRRGPSQKLFEERWTAWYCGCEIWPRR
jgi:hypothetical protein